MTLLNTLLETCTTLSHRVAALEQDKIAQVLEIIKLKKRVKRLEKKRRSKLFSLKRLRKVGTSQMVESSTEIVGRIERKDDDNAAAKEVNADEPTMFDDEEVTMTMAQILIKMKAKKARILDEQMAKRLHDEEVKKAATREKKEKDDFKRAQECKRSILVRPIFKREYYKVQTFLKPDRDEEPTKKRVAKETLLQESFKKLRAEVEVSVSEFKVEALQVKYPLIDWEIHSE
nr:hypothetical protein [Tanacetum cinerariifolium]